MTILNRFVSSILGRPPAIVSVTPTAKDPQFLAPLVIPKAVASPVAVDRVLTNGPIIAIVNQSTSVTDEEVAKVVPALQIQVDRDFEPIWELGGNLVFVPSGQTVPPNAWVIYLLDHSDQDGALGYHDLSTAGLPVAKVFVGDDKKYNLSWTVTLSHELLEMLLDPEISDTVFVQQTETSGILFAKEVADSVEDDKFGYEIDGVLVSDFVTPFWFMASAPKDSRFSFGNNVHAPFEIAPGGYIGYFEVSSSSTGWQQETHASGPGQRLLARGPDCRLAKIVAGKRYSNIVVGKNTYKK